MRDRIGSIRPNLMQSIAQATGMTGKQLDSNADVKLFAQTVSDPTKSYEANIAAIRPGTEAFPESEREKGSARTARKVTPRPSSGGRGRLGQSESGCGWINADLHGDKAPNGKTYKIQGPAGASDDDVRSQVLKQFPEAGQAPKAAPAAKPALQADDAAKVYQDARAASSCTLLICQRRHSASASHGSTDPRIQGIRRPASAKLRTRKGKSATWPELRSPRNGRVVFPISRSR